MIYEISEELANALCIHYGIVEATEEEIPELLEEFLKDSLREYND